MTGKLLCIVVMFLAVAGCSSRTMDQRKAPSPSAMRNGSSAVREPVSVQDTVRATLQLSKIGWLTLKVENTGKKSLTFIDIREGSSPCNEVWRVEIILMSGKTLRSFGFYAPFGVPRPVTVNPGAVYTRELQPVAYVESYKPAADETATVRIHHEVSDNWYKLYPEHQMVTFSSEPIEVKLGKLLY